MVYLILGILPGHFTACESHPAHGDIGGGMQCCQHLGFGFGGGERDSFSRGGRSRVASAEGGVAVKCWYQEMGQGSSNVGLHNSSSFSCGALGKLIAHPCSILRSQYHYDFGCMINRTKPNLDLNVELND